MPRRPGAPRSRAAPAGAGASGCRPGPAWGTAKQHRERDLRLHPGQRRAEAVVGAGAERQRLVRLPGRVELVRAGSGADPGCPRQAVPGPGCTGGMVTPPCATASSRHHREVSCYRRVVAQHLLHKGPARPGRPAGRAARSGWLSRERRPLPSRLVVVSKPATSSRISVDMSSPADSTVPSASCACTRAVVRSVARLGPALGDQVAEVQLQPARAASAVAHVRQHAATARATTVRAAACSRNQAGRRPERRAARR